LRYVLTGAFGDPDLIAAITGKEPRLEYGATLIDVEDAALMARLDFYLDVHAAERQPSAGGAVRVGAGSTRLSGHDFSGSLSLRWRAIWREAAGEILHYHGRQSSHAVRARLTMIWCRAESRLRAREAPRIPLGGLDGNNVRIHDFSVPYAKFFILRDYVYSHDLFGGGDSGPLSRAAMVMADAVTVLPWDPVRDRVLVIEQVRPSPIARGDPSRWLPEPVAGRIDPGDTPEGTARKEAREEARIELAELHKIGEYYPSTGAFSEYLYSFVGTADLPDGAGKLGGLETEGEDIRGHVMPRARLMAMIADGQAPVGPLILSALWLDRHADRLRRAG